MTDPNFALDLYRDLPGSLAVHLHQIDLQRDRALLVRLSPQDYAQASFLDQRVLNGHRPRAWFPWQRIEERMQGCPAGMPAHYILHIGHCGSTLISRLLGELGVNQLREPLPLRTFAQMHIDLGTTHCRWPTETFESRLSLTLGLYARGAGPKAVKASSFCNDLAPAMLASNPSVHATIVYAALRPYITNMLAGPNSQIDLTSLAPMRLRRLSARLGTAPAFAHEMSPGVAAAMSWATEISALAELMDRHDTSRVQTIDFDAFLADVRSSLRRLAEHAFPGVQDTQIDAAAADDTLTRYSKAPEHHYDAMLRRRVLADAEFQWGDEIRKGLQWIARTATRYPLIARAADRFGGL